MSPQIKTMDIIGLFPGLGIQEYTNPLKNKSINYTSDDPVFVHEPVICVEISLQKYYIASTKTSFVNNS
jgi:hypothetical protein